MYIARLCRPVLAILVLVLIHNPCSAIKRSAVISRAKAWADIAVPYNQTLTHDGYRTDCSGLVSYSWATTDAYGQPRSYWVDEIGSICTPISKDDLKPGDMMMNNNWGHSLMFDSWADGMHTSYWAYEMGGIPQYARYHLLPYPYDPDWDSTHYFPYRYNGIEEDASITVTTIGAAKALTNGTVLQLGCAQNTFVVTAGTSVFSDRIYIEQLDRSNAIAVQYTTAGSPAIVEGDLVWIGSGIIDTVNGERMIRSAVVKSAGHRPPLAPLFMAAPDLGGCTQNQCTPGVNGGVGLNNIGLLIKTYGGKVNYRDPQGNFFYLDNGDRLCNIYGCGIHIVCNGLVGGAKLAMPFYGQRVVVTGISSVVTSGGTCFRAVRPRTQADIQVINGP